MNNYNDNNKTINIWENTAIKANVTLTPFLAKNNKNGISVIICPGGSYFWHAFKTEGTEVAKWLNKNGISAFVLKYRVSGVFSFLTYNRLIFPRKQHPDMIMDLQRSIQSIRENYNDYKVNPNHIGVMGFSAGGHLVLSSALFHKTNYLNNCGLKVKVSLRPDFVAAIYPVITMQEEFVHKRSRRGLLGERNTNNKSLLRELSLEKNIPNDCCPIFLMNCKDDPIVKYQNSELFDSALTAKSIEHKYIQYKTGGHGFGTTHSKTSDEAIMWCDEFLNWLNNLINSHD